MRGNMIKDFFAKGAGFLMTSAVLLAPVSVACTSIISLCMEWAFEFESISPNSVEETSVVGLGATRIVSALAIAPVVENFLCLLWARWLPTWSSQHSWWSKPFLIACIAAVFHSLIFWDIRPIAVLPGFFMIAMYIENAHNKLVGYWTSVAHHFCINAINLLLVLFVSK